MLHTCTLAMSLDRRICRSPEFPSDSCPWPFQYPPIPVHAGMWQASQVWAATWLVSLFALLYLSDPVKNHLISCSSGAFKKFSGVVICSFSVLFYGAGKIHGTHGYGMKLTSYNHLPGCIRLTFLLLWFYDGL